MDVDGDGTTLGGGCLRWREGRSGYVIDRETFDPSRYGIEVIGDGVARAFVARHHYAKTYPAAVLAVGLFRAGAGLQGVAVFSVPMQPRAAAAYGAGAARFCELGRLCLLDEVPANGETAFYRRALGLLARERRRADGRPSHEVVLAYSDPMPRSDASGRIVLPGHVGFIYGKAGGARYLGRATPRTLWLAPDASVVSDRALSKIRTGERGAAAAHDRLVAFGAPTMARGEDPRAWVGRALREGPFRRVRHPGNHVYAFACGSRAERRRMRDRLADGGAYPKGGGGTDRGAAATRRRS